MWRVSAGFDGFSGLRSDIGIGFRMDQTTVCSDLHCVGGV